MTSRRIIVIACVVVGLVALVALAGDVRAAANHLANYDVRFLVAGLALTTTNYLLRFVRWQRYLALIDVVVPRRDSARIFVAGFVMSISPGKLGEVLKSALLEEQHGIPVAHTAPVVLAERITDLIALIVLVAIAGTTEPDGLPIALAGAAIVTMVLVPLMSPGVAESLLGLAERLPRVSAIAPKLRDAYASTRQCLAGGALVMGTAIAVLGWSLECAATYVIVRGFDGASLTPMGATFCYAAPTILGALSMLPGGLVATEASMASLFARLGTGVSPAIASGTTLLVRLATLWWAVALGWVGLALHGRVMAVTKRDQGAT